MQHSRYFDFVCCIGASLLALTAISGCSLILDAGNVSQQDDRRNAYNCQCDFESESLNELDSIEVAAENDDAIEVNGEILPVEDGLRMATDSLVAVRFTDLGIPRNATVKSAYLQFTAAENSRGEASIDIAVENSVAADTFSGPNVALISERELTEVVAWDNVDPWGRGDNGPNTETPNLAAAVNDVVTREGWNESSALVFVFKGGAGERVAESYEAPDGGLGVPVLSLAYADVVTANLDVCLNASIPAGDSGLELVLAADCEGRVQQTVTGLAEAVGYFEPGETNIACRISEDETGRFAGICDGTCVEKKYNGENFNPTAANQCIDDAVESCAADNTTPADCTGVQDCLALIGATNAEGDLPVCLAIGPDADTSSATQYALASQLFGQRSVCNVEGMTEVTVKGEEPKKQPLTEGTLEILGGPCPDETCRVGFSSELKSDDIEFDVRFAPDPVFKGLAQTALTYPGVVQVGGGGPRTLADGAAEAVSRGRRKSERVAFVANNSSTTTPLQLAVDWKEKTCDLEGELVANVAAGVCDGTEDLDDPVGCFLDSDCTCESCEGNCSLPAVQPDLSAITALSGVLVNQPPSANAGGLQTVECTSPDGAEFQLDCGGSLDPDGNDIRFVKWRAGSRLGPIIATEASTTAGLGVGESETYYCLVVDSFAQIDEDRAAVEVLDTTPPEISCNAPDVINPVDAADDKPGPKEAPRQPVSFTATATDVCDTEVTPVVSEFDCIEIKPNGKVIDKTESCEVSLVGDSVTILDSGGVNTQISWVVSATDDSGNTAEAECRIQVVRP